MTRFRRLKNYLVGFGAVGGTAAVVAVVIDNYWGWSPYLTSLKTHLVAESEQPKPTNSKWDYNWDKRDVSGLDVNNNRAASRATRNIILIRHGQYNLDGKTDSERVLTTLGIEQAKLTGLRLAELSLPYTHIVRSRMSRAIQTADLIHEALPNVPLLPEDGVLNEGAPIQPEPKSVNWRPDYYYDTDGPRIEAAFRKYFHRADASQEEDSYEIIVCHANVIRYFLCRALQFPPEAWLRMSLKHASLSWIVIKPDGKVHCRGIGEAGHFPPNMLTTS